MDHGQVVEDLAQDLGQPHRHGAGHGLLTGLGRLLRSV